MLRKSNLLAASVLAGLPRAFLNTNSGSQLFVCATAQFADLDATAYAALTWVEVKGVGHHGEAGTTTNILTYNTWATDVAQKAKGVSNAGDPDVELARIPTDPGQIILRDASLTKFNYAFKIVRTDKPSTDGTPTIIYNRGVVSGPKRPFGRNEDFDLEVFSLGLNQREIVIAPTDPP